MLKAIKASLAFMTPKERSSWYLLTGLRAILAIFDLVGILAIGFVVTSTAIFLTAGSDPKRVLEFGGLEIPAVNAQTLPWVAGGVLVTFLLKAVISVALLRRAAYFVAGVEARAGRAIAEIGFGGDLSDARERSREEMMFAIQAGSPAAFNTLLNATNSLVAEAMLFLIVCIGFLFVDPVTTAAAMGYFALIAVLIHYFVGSSLAKAGQVAAVGTIQASTAISDLLSVFRELSVLKKRTRYVEQIYEAKLSSATSSARSYYLSGMPRYIIEAALLIGVALFILAQAASLDIVGSAGTIGIFLTGGFRLTAALLPLQASLLTIRSAVPWAEKAQEILALGANGELEKSEQVREAPTLNESVQPLGVSFECVSYSYAASSESAVTDLTFRLEPGSQVALMGPSGAGKSTIADLICRVLEPSKGKISTFTGGSTSTAMETARVGYVPQRPGMVSGTIADNVALGVERTEVEEGLVVEALELAQLGDLLNNLPEGIHTTLGKLQDGLSGGQMQRLGLARAFYARPNLLVMDEATSALDAESEAGIQRALDTMRGNVTVVLIAHRLNTIQHADTVLLIEEGRLTDSGTFKQLIARNPSVERVADLMRVDRD
jgi:ATP-binding cassette subfamily C protein